MYFYIFYSSLQILKYTKKIIRKFVYGDVKWYLESGLLSGCCWKVKIKADQWCKSIIVTRWCFRRKAEIHWRNSSPTTKWQRNRWSCVGGYYCYLWYNYNYTSVNRETQHQIWRLLITVWKITSTKEFLQKNMTFYREEFEYLIICLNDILIDR